MTEPSFANRKTGGPGAERLSHIYTHAFLLLFHARLEQFLLLQCRFLARQ